MKILTANRLSDGEAVWLSADRHWAIDIEGAELARDADTEAKLEAAGKKALANNEVVDVNLIDVSLVEGSIRPNRLREQIRAFGPTTHPALGKQARPAARQAA